MTSGAGFGLLFGQAKGAAGVVHGVVGELALHNTVYALTKALGGGNVNSPLHAHYESAKIAELNKNEQRGADYIRVVGGFLDICYRVFSTIFHQFL